MESRSIIIIWRSILALFCLGAVIWIIDQNIPFAGTKRIAYTFGSLKGSVSQLRPLSRASAISTTSKQYGQTVFEDPVYFDVKTVIPYTKAIFKVKYQNNSGRVLGMGVKVGQGWRFEIKKFKERAEDELVALKQGEGELTVGEAEFQLPRGSYANGRYTFLFSIPGMTIDKRETEYVYFSDMEIILKREDLITTATQLWKR